MPANNFYIAMYDEGLGVLSFPYFVDEVDPPPQPKKIRIGVATFSSAMDHAMDLRRCGVVLVGQPTGGKPNSSLNLRRLNSQTVVTNRQACSAG